MVRWIVFFAACAHTNVLWTHPGRFCRALELDEREVAVACRDESDQRSVFDRVQYRTGRVVAHEELTERVLGGYHLGDGHAASPILERHPLVTSDAACRRTAGGRRFVSQNLDHLHVVEPDGTHRRLNGPQPAAYNACFLDGGARAVWSGYSPKRQDYVVTVSAVDRVAPEEMPDTYGLAGFGVGSDGAVYGVRRGKQTCAFRVDLAARTTRLLACVDGDRDGRLIVDPPAQHAAWLLAVERSTVVDAHWLSLPDGRALAPPRKVACPLSWDDSGSAARLSRHGILLCRTGDVMDLSTGKGADLSAPRYVDFHLEVARWLDDDVLLMARSGLRRDGPDWFEVVRVDLRALTR